MFRPTHRPARPLPTLAMLIPRSLDDVSSTLRLSRRTFLRWNRTGVVFVSLACLGTFVYLLGRLPDPSPPSLPPPPTFPPRIVNPALFPGGSPSINSVQTITPGDDLEQDWAGLLPPDDPPLSSVPVRDEWHPELSSPAPSRPPVHNPFPADRLKELYPDEPPGRRQAPPPLGKGRGGRKLSRFASSWRPPTLGQPWDSPPQIQADDAAFAKQSKAREALVHGRREVIRNGFLVAWEGYKKTSFG